MTKYHCELCGNKEGFGTICLNCHKKALQEQAEEIFKELSFNLIPHCEDKRTLMILRSQINILEEKWRRK